MRTFHYKRNAHFCPSINVDRLWSMVPEGVYEKAKTDSNMAPVIDVTKLVSQTLSPYIYTHYILVLLL
jgi:large subunit ribosomal protein L27Ae